MYNIQSELADLDEELRRCSLYSDRQSELQNKKIEIIISSLVYSDNDCKILPPELSGKYKLMKYQGKRITLANAIRMYNLGVTPEDSIGNTYRTCNNAECFNPEHLVSSKELRYMQLARMVDNRPSVMQNRGGNSPRARLSIEDELARQEAEIFGEYTNPEAVENTVNTTKPLDSSIWDSLTAEEWKAENEVKLTKPE